MSKNLTPEEIEKAINVGRYIVNEDASVLVVDNLTIPPTPNPTVYDAVKEFNESSDFKSRAEYATPQDFIYEKYSDTNSSKLINRTKLNMVLEDGNTISIDSTLNFQYFISSSLKDAIVSQLKNQGQLKSEEEEQSDFETFINSVAINLGLDPYGEDAMKLKNNHLETMTKRRKEKLVNVIIEFVKLAESLHFTNEDISKLITEHILG